jgi:hypothetical protein
MSAATPDNNARVIMLAFGKMDNGGQYWVYVAVKPSRFDEFQLAMASKKYNIQDFEHDEYGEVIVSGEGILPPQEVTKQVADIFNVPVKELFANVDPAKLINTKIQQLNEEQ